MIFVSCVIYFIFHLMFGWPLDTEFQKALFSIILVIGGILRVIDFRLYFGFHRPQRHILL